MHKIVCDPIETLRSGPKKFYYSEIFKISHQFVLSPGVDVLRSTILQLRQGIQREEVNERLRKQDDQRLLPTLRRK